MSLTRQGKGRIEQWAGFMLIFSWNPGSRAFWKFSRNSCLFLKAITPFRVYITYIWPPNGEVFPTIFSQRVTSCRLAVRWSDESSYPLGCPDCREATTGICLQNLLIAQPPLCCISYMATLRHFVAQRELVLAACFRLSSLWRDRLAALAVTN